MFSRRGKQEGTSLGTNFLTTCFFVLSTLGLMSLSLLVDHSYSLQTAEKRNARFHAKAYDAADTGAVSQRGFPRDPEAFTLLVRKTLHLG